jgi:hypothetical protein
MQVFVFGFVHGAADPRIRSRDISLASTLSGGVTVSGDVVEVTPNVT